MDKIHNPSILMDDDLRSLADECGIVLAYSDMNGQTVIPTTDSVLAMVQALGLAANNVTETAEVTKRMKERRQRRVIEPVLTAWDGRLYFLPMLITPTANTVRAKLILESGDVRHYIWDDFCTYIQDPNPLASFQEIKLPFPELLPWGYHRLIISLSDREFESLVISTPVHAFAFAENQKSWGVFSPLYALRSDSNWGAGDTGDLRLIARFCAELGGNFVALLPLLPVFLKEWFNPSPYSPVSRTFWNEFYINPATIPEMVASPKAGALFGSAIFQKKLSDLRISETVDYRKVVELKRSLLEILAEEFFRRRPEPRWGQYKTFLAENSDVELYARFRAISEERGTAWRDWPVSQKAGFIAESDCRLELLRYHRYSQFVIQTQLADVVSEIRRSGQSLYLDLPLGVHPDGYDAWQEQENSIPGMSVGAPPDPAFPSGQDWGFQPPHPERQRENGYRSFIRTLRHHMKFAGILRLDHIMGMHRLFCIPSGKSPSEGLYLKYNAEEMYAILCLESQRHQTAIVGEDLGLVPPEVRPMMNHHKIYRSFVAQYEMTENFEATIPTPPNFSVASLNTHDLPPFAAYWGAEDIPERLTLGVLEPGQSELEKELRRKWSGNLIRFLDSTGSLIDKEPLAGFIGRWLIENIAQSRAQLLLINLADLWEEHQAQNVPGTTEQRPNWRIKAVVSLDNLQKDTSVKDFLRRINTMRKTN